MSQQWDVICVGGGISSLAFGAQLARLEPDARVLVIDKHYAPGGYATVFYRRQKRFDCSLHKMSGMGAGGNLRRILLDDLALGGEVEPVHSEDYFEVQALDTAAVLANEYGAAKAQLQALFPHEKAALDAFFAEVDLHGRNGYYQLQVLDGTFEADIAALRYAHKNLKKITVAAALAERFKDPLLREVLAAPGIYVGGFPEDLGYLYYLHVVYATLVCGNAYIKGSSQHLSNTLAKRIEAAGGQVLTKTEVTRILVDAAGHAVGVETSRGSFHAPRIVVNASPHYAVKNLFGSGARLEPVKEKLATLKPSRSTTTLYAVCDAPPETLGLASAETMVFSPDFAAAAARRDAARLAPADSALAEAAYWQASTMEVTNYHLLDAAGGPVVCLNVLDTVDHWPERGTLDYKAKKARAAKVLMDRLLAVKPGLAGHVRFSEVSTPRTYERYTNNTAGAGYGALVGTDLQAHVFHHQFPVKGVHFLSAWVAGPSYEAAFGYAQMKARQVAAEWRRGRPKEVLS